MTFQLILEFHKCTCIPTRIFLMRASYLVCCHLQPNSIIIIRLFIRKRVHVVPTWMKDLLVLLREDLLLLRQLQKLYCNLRVNLPNLALRQVPTLEVLDPVPTGELQQLMPAMKQHEQLKFSQTCLDKYVYNYMKKKNFHTTAEIFGAEPDISPNAVSIDSDEGFLREWWHVFWSTYNSRTTETHEHEEVPPQNLLVPSSDSDPMFDMWPAVPPCVSPSVMVPGPGIESFPERSDFPRMMPTTGFRSLTSSFNEPSGTHGNGTLTLPNRDFYSSSPFLNANQLDRHMLPSSSNSYPSERVCKNLQLCLTKDDKCGSGIWSSTIAGPARYPPKPTGLIIKSPDASVPQIPVLVPGLGPATLVADVRGVREQDQFWFPTNNSNFNPDRASQLLLPSPTDYRITNVLH